MRLRELYYDFKPLLPRGLRYWLRRRLARHTLAAHRHVWPIDPGSSQPAPGWPGWPEGRDFAFALSHDVEGPEGLAQCQALAEVEMEQGFRSSFNFIPEGPYRVPAELRTWLTSRGFEVGVHDLHHDGKLFRSRAGFSRKAGLINRYLEEWQAAGFRAGLMHSNLPWQHEIRAEYDASTFDTDPFEPQPEGAGTIFPYWVASGSGGFLELPYTLPQDSTLFLILREPSPRIWHEKLAWLATQRGLAFVTTHPDYIAFGDHCPDRQYPVKHYRDFLAHVRTRHAGRFWHALPREVARYARTHRQALPHRTSLRGGPRPRPAGAKIWIDLENTPHIPFFAPIIAALQRKGHTVVLTARDAYQTCEMADLYGMRYDRLGRHYGRHLALKLAGLGIRITQLLPFALREKPDLALNHGARAQTEVCSLLGIPNVLLMDYEHSSSSGLNKSQWNIFPAVVADQAGAKGRGGKILSYRGIKEDVYVAGLRPDPAILPRLGLDPRHLIITVRPPATEAHYHNREAEVLFREFMRLTAACAEARLVILPRNRRQEVQLRAEFRAAFESGQAVIPGGVVDGMNLLWHSDLVVSGGGTMNREAAALGVPVYSIFRGTIGAVDRHLAATGRLTLVESVGDVAAKIQLVRRDRSRPPDQGSREALDDILGHIEAILQQTRRN